jgi:hypothetical protein
MPPPACPNPVCTPQAGNYYAWTCNSPIIVDVEDKGFHLTSAAGGVLFNFSGHKEQVAWTDPTCGNAWLVLDRNNNGAIDDATELFGNFTPQPQTAAPNGFLALAVYDSPANGGDDDGSITNADQIYSHLLLWTDKNHNGISEPNELRSLAAAGITSISLSYRQGTRTDGYGNTFRFRSYVKMTTSTNSRRLIYDVYLAGAN